MFCKKCGGSISETERFCKNCGESVNPPEKGLNMHNEPRQRGGFLMGLIGGILIAAVLIGALSLTGVLGARGKVEGKGFGSGEEAVEAYLKALSKGDVDGMLSAVAVETYVENFDLEAYITRTRAALMNMPQLFPAGASELTMSLNKAQREYDATQDIKYQYLTLLMPDSELLTRYLVVFSEDVEIRRFVKELGSISVIDELKTLELKEFIEPSALSDVYGNSVNQKIMQQNADMFGADNIESKVVLAEIDGEEYLFCFDTAEYDGKWFILDFGGNIGTVLGIPLTCGGMALYDEFKQ